MDLTVTKRDIVRLVERCQGVADKKSTMPVLANVLLSTQGTSELRIAATDLYVSVSGIIPVQIKKGGSIAVPARDLYERIKMMPDGPLQIVTGDGGLAKLKSASSAREYKLHGMPGDDFPSLPEPDASAATFEIELDLLSTLIARTHFSISTDETRAALNSALFEWDGDRVRMVTTDGHRLSKMEATIEGMKANATMLVPLKAVRELRALSDRGREDASRDAGKDETAQRPRAIVQQSGPNAFFQIGGVRFSVKLVDAQFPPYAQVIPQSTERSVRLPRVALIDALKAVKLAASDRTGGVRLEVSPGKVGIKSESPETGEAYDEVSADYAGAPVTIGFNAQYFLDVLGSLDDDEIVLGIGGDLDPAVVRPASESATRDFRAVIMPMRI